MKRLCLCFAVIVIPLAVSAEIGSLAAVNRDVEGTRPSEQPRTLSLNDRLIQNERIKTSADSGGQVLFLDQTTLTLSPNSDIILDKYVYDPDKDSGDLQITMLKGAMRMVGGRITKKSDATIKTPSATIGIRGGMGDITVKEDGSTVYMHIAGFKATISTRKGGAPMTITREGGVASVSAPAGGPAAFVSAALSSSGAGVAAGGGGSGGSASSSGQTTSAGDGGAGAGAATSGGVTGDQQAGAATGDQQGGSEATFLGVASPEMVSETMGRTAGTGDGGSVTASAPGATDKGVSEIEAEISARPGAVNEPPISTTGEQQEVLFNEESFEFAAPPIEEFADNNQAAAIAAELTQIFDAVTFSGVWSPLAGLSNGDIVLAEGLAFRMNYSLTAQEGFITIELPDTGDLAEANLTTFDGAAISGDRFLVVGDEARNVFANSDSLSLLGGDAEGSVLAISAEDVASGSIFVDYDGSSLTNTLFVEGAITPVTGRREIEINVSNRTNEVRQLLNQR